MPRSSARRGVTAVASATLAPGLALTLALALAPSAQAADEPEPTPATAPAAASGEESGLSEESGESEESGQSGDEQRPPAAPQTRRPLRVRLRTASRRTRTVSTTRAWAWGLLTQEGFAVDRDDIVRVSRKGRIVRRTQRRRLRAGDTVTLVVVTHRRSSVRRTVRPRRVTRTVSRLAPGQRRVVAPGRAGVRRVTTRRTLHDGRVVRRSTSHTTLRRARPRRVLVGRAVRSVRGADGRRWRALARCESGNNPRAVNPSGTYHGLYQFDRGTWASVGGSGLPSRASAAEQTHRAKILFTRRGRSPWPHCGRYL